MSCKIIYPMIVNSYGVYLSVLFFPPDSLLRSNILINMIKKNNYPPKRFQSLFGG